MNLFEFKIASRYLKAQRKSFSSSVILLFSFFGVVIGVWLLIFVLSIVNGFEKEVTNQLISKDSHFEVVQYYYEPFRKDSVLFSRVSTNPMVRSVSPYLKKQVVIAGKSEFSGAEVNGIDAEKSSKVLAIKDHILQGAYYLDSLPNEKQKKRPTILLGYLLAEKLGLSVGDECYLYIITKKANRVSISTPKVVPFVVSGLFETGIYEYDISGSYIDLKVAQKIFSQENKISGYHGKVINLQHISGISRQLEQSLPVRYRVVSWREKNNVLIQWIDYEKIVVGLALSIIIIIASFNIISSVIMNVNNKRREIGILRAMGASRGNILKIFIGQGFIIGFLGSSIGILLGLLTCYLQVKFNLIALPGDVYLVESLPIDIKVRDITLVFLISNVLCIVSSFFPALYAGKQKPVEVIRDE